MKSYFLFFAATLAFGVLACSDDTTPSSDARPDAARDTAPADIEGQEQGAVDLATADAAEPMALTIVPVDDVFHLVKGDTQATRLYLWLPGSSGPALAYPTLIDAMGAIPDVLAISLKYHNERSIGSICQCDDACYETQRSARAFGGGDVPEGADVASRLAALLGALGAAQFLDCEAPQSICWQKIVVAGSSQGAGMAAFIGQKYRVMRINQYAGTVDMADPCGAGASWLKQPFVTPTSDNYGAVHLQDSYANEVERNLGPGHMNLPGEWARIVEGPGHKNYSAYACPGMPNVDTIYPGSGYAAEAYHPCLARDPVFADYWRWASGLE